MAEEEELQPLGQVKTKELAPDTAHTYYINRSIDNKVSCSTIKDQVDGNYTVDLGRPLPKFDTAFGKAYEASDHSGQSEKELYCVLLDKHAPIRIAEINKLVGKKIDNFTNIVAAQIMPLSVGKGRAFALIIEKPAGMPLAKFLVTNGRVNTDYITKKLVPIISNVIAHFADLRMIHGRLNLTNIYIDDKNKLTVGECVSEPCGYSQPALFEVMSRATAAAVGKGGGSLFVDYYALGILAAVLIRGSDPVAGLSSEEVLERKFREGAYDVVTKGVEIPSHILDLLRGVLNEKKANSWGVKQMKEWVDGRIFNLLSPSDHIEDGRAITFNDKKYSHRRHLAHAMYLEWDYAKKFVRQDDIIKWLDQSPQEDDLIEYLEMISSRFAREQDIPGFDRDDELLAQYIILLDPSGPVRLKGFSANIDALGAMLSYGFTHDKKLYVDGIQHIILRHLLSIVANNAEIVGNQNKHDMLIAIQKCNELLRKTDLGFGIERCLYELNPCLPCQSPAILDDVVFTKEELLLVLEKNETIGGKILDKHMAAFLSERLDLSVRIHISALTRFPEFLGNIYIQVLALLSLAQQTGTAGELPNLSQKIYDGLKNVVNDFYSKTIKKNAHAALSKAVDQGILANLLRVISDPKYIVRDRLGFKKAVNQYRENAIQVVKLSNKKAINNAGYKDGLQLAVMISFFIATVELVVLVIQAF